MGGFETDSANQEALFFWKGRQVCDQPEGLYRIPSAE